MIGKLDDYLQFNEAALSLRSQRQQVLASNIANADTPNYKARDLDFNSALAGAMNGASPTSAAAGTPAAPTLLYRAPVQGAVDGNTVDMDVERNQFADNAIRYEAGITMINAQIRNMMAAIQGGQ